MKEDTVLSDRIDLCRIFIFFSVSVCVSSTTTTERGPTPINLGWIFFIFFNILVIITVFFQKLYLVFSYLFE